MTNEERIKAVIQDVDPLRGHVQEVEYWLVNTPENALSFILHHANEGDIMITDALDNGVIELRDNNLYAIRDDAPQWIEDALKKQEVGRILPPPLSATNAEINAWYEEQEQGAEQEMNL